MKIIHKGTGPNTVTIHWPNRSAAQHPCRTVYCFENVCEAKMFERRCKLDGDNITVNYPAEGSKCSHEAAA